MILNHTHILSKLHNAINTTGQWTVFFLMNFSFIGKVGIMHRNFYFNSGDHPQQRYSQI
jgi:hypothetical protein